MTAVSHAKSQTAGRLRIHIARGSVRTIMILVTLVSLFPVLWNGYNAFKTNAEFMRDPMALPSGLAWENFSSAVDKLNIGANALNSIYVVAIALAVIIVCVVPCSYCLARYRFFGSRVLLNISMAAIFIQAVHIMIPLFMQMSALGLTEKLTPLGILYGVTQFPFSIFLMSGYMRTIPKEYEEEAMNDGAGNWRILIRVIAPMAKPGIMTVCMLSAMAAWNEYPIALVMLTKPENYTLPLGLSRLFEVARYKTDWGAMFAALLIVLIPTIALYAVGQRYLIQGISAGGIKE